MQIIRGSGSLKKGSGPYAVGIGIFDGVHKGHQALLLRAKEAAAQEGIASLAYTFDPHPAALLNPSLAPRQVEPLETRLQRFSNLGMDAALVEPFSHEFAAIDAKRFAEEILFERLSAKHIVIGRGFRFGAGQKGDVAMLEEIARGVGTRIHSVDLVRVGGIEVSSTKVREFVRAGKMSGAHLLLGRPFALTGSVERGAQRGTGLGFATANLKSDNELLPGGGVYAAVCQGPFGSLGAVVNVGYAPTFGEKTMRVEAHLLDYSGEPLYGETLTLEFLERLRGERRFDGVEQLKAQIEKDVGEARALLDKKERR